LLSAGSRLSTFTRYNLQKPTRCPRRYFSGEPLELLEEVLQVAREGLDDQVLDAGVGVPVDQLEDPARVTVKCGPGCACPPQLRDLNH